MREIARYPDPMVSKEDHDRLHNHDLADMDRLELHREQGKAEFLLMLLGDSDQVIAITPAGELITARTWLLQRLELIRRALRGAM